MDFDLTPYEEIKRRCLELRAKTPPVTEADVEKAEQLVAPLRAAREAMPEQSTPPPDTARALSYLGWGLYEISWALVQRVPSDWEDLTGPRRVEVEREFALLKRTAEAARGLPWPEYAPRALGALRAAALGESKRNTPMGYDKAWSCHGEARWKHEKFVNQVSTEPDLVLSFKEVLIQLDLAETGTACREPERVVALWDFRDPADHNGDRRRGEQAVQRMHQRLRAGVTRGDNAIRSLLELASEGGPGLPDEVDELRLLTPANFRNPGVMTTRAYLIMLPMTTVMAALNRMPAGYASWEEARQTMLDQARWAYRIIERVADDIPLIPDHRRSVVQLRLNLAFVSPGFELPSALTFADCLQRSVLDKRAIEELSAWLAEEGDDRGDANIIGSAMLPSYLAGLRDLVGSDGWDAYVDWRRRWPQLDRHKDHPDRAAQFALALERVARIDSLQRT